MAFLFNWGSYAPPAQSDSGAIVVSHWTAR